MTRPPHDRGTPQGAQAPRWWDAHCHLADPRVAPHLEAWRTEAEGLGIGTWVQGGVGPEDWQRQKALRLRWGDRVRLSFGLHPWWVAAHTEAEVEGALIQLRGELPGAQALGELGLDHHPRHAPPESHGRQRRAFESQLPLARARTLPVVLHVVDAHGAALEVLEAAAPPHRGLVHSFSAGPEVARRYVDLGFCLSFGGTATRDGYRALKETLRWVPLDRLLIETDAPDQPPQLPGGERPPLTRPAHLRDIAEAVGALRGASPEEILDASTENLRKLLGP